MPQEIVVTLAIITGRESIHSAIAKGLITRQEYEAVYNQAHDLYCNHWTVNPVGNGYNAIQRLPGWARRVR